MLTISSLCMLSAAGIPQGVLRLSLHITIQRTHLLQLPVQLVLQPVAEAYAAIPLLLRAGEPLYELRCGVGHGPPGPVLCCPKQALQEHKGCIGLNPGLRTRKPLLQTRQMGKQNRRGGDACW